MGLGSRLGGVVRERLRSLGYSLEPASAPRLALLIDPFLRLFGQRLAMYASRPGGGYIDYQKTAAAARAANLPIPSYVARMWGEEGLIEWIVDRIAAVVPLDRCRTILEIGAGTGRTLDLVKARAKPATYEIYEPDRQWSAYLVEKYGVLDREADGVSLTPTATQSCDLVQAHGVFVYLPLGTAFRYFEEMIRVVRPGGWIVFDIFADDQVTLSFVQEWKRSGQGFHVLLPKRALVAMFAEGGCRLVDQFDQDDGTKALGIKDAHCQYLVFEKAR
jgi:SAM-dependent methyltransferase